MEKQAYQVRNYRMVQAKFIAPTNQTGARVKIFEVARYQDEKTKSKFFPYCYRTGDVMEQAYQILVSAGFHVVGRASDRDAYVFLCDNWGENFRNISDLQELPVNR